MSVAFFLTLKKELVCAKLTSTVRQVLEKMKYYECTQIIILDDKGSYAGTVSKEDLVSKMENLKIKFEDSNKIGIVDMVKSMADKAVNIDYNVDDLIMDGRNFVPVVDDNNIFIGVIKKSDIVNCEKYAENKKFSCV